MEQDRTPKPGKIYKHFKNRLYQVIAVAKHSETGEIMVVYQRLYDDYSVYVRPYDMFLSEVDHEKYPDIDQKYRFELWNKEPAKNMDKEGLMKSIDKPEPKSDNASFENEGCNPDLLAFLEADTYEEKRNILIGIRKRLDDRLINDIAASLDVTVDDGDLDIRYKSLMNCIDTMVKFECNRFR